MDIRFKSALNHIKADKALVSKTKGYLRNTLAKEMNSRMTELPKWRMLDMKKFAIAAFMAFLLIGGGFKAYATPLSYVSLDINPSVELGVNALGQVVTAEGYNEDGKAVLSGIKVTGKNVTEAVSAVVDSAAQKGFIENDGIILITAETDNDRKAAKLKAKAEAGANEALTENGKSAEVTSVNVALVRRDLARDLDLDITPGKLNLIQKLQAADNPTAEIDQYVDQYKEADVKDIMKAIKDIKKDEQTNNDKGGTVNNSDNGSVNNKDKGSNNSKDENSVNFKANNGKNGTGGNEN
jgi:hypothetical protein